jgi:hypothetical protein
MVSLLASLMLSAAGGGVDLAWKPKVAEKHLYSIVVTLDYGTTTVEFDSQLSTRVVSVDPDGSYSLETLTLNPTERSGDQVQDLQRQGPVLEKYDRRGAPIEKKDATPPESDPFAELMDHLTEYQTPRHAVAEGDSWTSEHALATSGAMADARLKYTLSELIRSGDHGYAQIAIEARKGKDIPIASGTLTLLRPSNSLFRLEEEIPKFLPTGANMPADVHITLQEV